jgi:hypothetical protein
MEERHLEEQNDAATDALHAKVDQLRSLSLDIRSHIKQDNKFLETELVKHLLSGLCSSILCPHLRSPAQDKDFDDSRSLLKRVTGRVDEIMAAGSSRQMCYLAVFILFVFLFLWKIVL